MSRFVPISRRTMLRGMGAVIALPMLDAMAPGQTTQPASGVGVPGKTIRSAVLYFPNGVNVPKWTPSTTGKAFELSPTLAPLADHRDDILVMGELMNANSVTGDGHYVKSSGFLTGTTITKTTGKDLRSGGISMDQLMAQTVGRNTPLPSLELGIEPVATGVDNNVGYTRLYASHISWSTPTTPVSKEINPRLAFDRLFRSRGQAGMDDRSVLDLVAEDAASLRSRIGKADQAKLDNYLESIRSVEKRIEFDIKMRAERQAMTPEQLTALDALDKRISTWEAIQSKDMPGERRRGTGDHSEHVRLMMDLIALAFWSDSTRVASFMFGNEVSNRNFTFVDGVRGSHHQISHHKREADALEQLHLINRWHVEQYAYLLDRLKEIKEGDSNLLDNSMILFGCGFSDGDRHDPKNLPLVLAGKGGGTLATGRHVFYDRNTPLCNLYVGMLRRMGVDVKKFSDSSEELAGLSDPSFAGAKA